jgi:hypothetical protein
MSVIRTMVLDRRDEAKVEGLNEVMSQSNARISRASSLLPKTGCSDSMKLTGR